MHRPSIRICAILALLPASLAAQSVRGVVIGAGDQPVPGAVVQLVDSVSQVAARALSDAHGAFVVTTSKSGTYRLRTLRIGYRPTLSDPVELRSGGEVTKQLTLSAVPVGLDTVRVVDANVCRAFTDSGAATYRVWEQIRTALSATELTTASRAVSATTVTYDRTLDKNSGRVLQQRSVVSTGYVTRAWRTAPPDSLHRAGYTITRRDNTVDYYAPGLDMLLSSVFVDDHCFRLTTDRKQASLLGIAFEPTPERKKGNAEIRGTIWVDRASSELRRMEFRYVNVTPEVESQAGGQLEFVRMRDGAWAIASWNIRMPVVEQFIVPGHGAELRVTSVQVAGGDLALSRRGADTLWTRPPMSLAGVVLDSLSGSPVRDARVSLAGSSLTGATDSRGRFTISGVLPGQYTLEVRTASLDSVMAVHRSSLTVTDVATPVELRVPSGQQVSSTLCGSTAGTRESATGMVLGQARRADSSASRSMDHLKVVAEWTVDSTVRRVETTGTADGAFRFCAVPVNVALILRASADSVETAAPSTIRIPEGTRLARTELTLERTDVLARVASVFVGVVINDSTHAPIPGAEIALTDLAKSVLADARGAFRVEGIPPGEHQLRVRAIGYGAADTRLTFKGNETVERRVVLGRAVMLEAVNVEATRPLLPSFEENRKLGLGHFLTRADLAKRDNMSLVSFLESMNGLRVVHGPTGRAWAIGTHPPGSLRGVAPDAPDSVEGAPVSSCWTHVYLNDVPVFSGKIIRELRGLRGASVHWEPLFDVSTFTAAQVEAIEFYASPAETPLKYQQNDPRCGVLVIWTRRSR